MKKRKCIKCGSNTNGNEVCSRYACRLDKPIKQFPIANCQYTFPKCGHSGILPAENSSNDFAYWHNNRTKAEGGWTCKACAKMYGAIYAKLHPKERRKMKKRGYNFARVEILIRAKERREKNPEKSIWSSAKTRSKKNNIPFNIELSDIVIPEFCPILGIPIKLATNTPAFTSPSLDRIKPELGYIKGNVRIISHRANTLKNSATIKELELILADLKAIENQMPLQPLDKPPLALI